MIWKAQLINNSVNIQVTPSPALLFEIVNVHNLVSVTSLAVFGNFSSARFNKNCRTFLASIVEKSTTINSFSLRAQHLLM